ncbi:MAG: class I SAM-dependent methyltransferase [Rhizobiales bacterium]|nr:class I SAM-dependent methyltransferase [Hyphomicrobiales bacterium]MBI3673581.1 class I SAM-dependent methyltransferase [Hyphomicrobiales bacterium]
MTEPQIRFDDGAAYERMMGGWSRLAGAVFLEWLAPGQGLRWIDVGCGNGAFTELIVERSAPAQVQGIDPSEAQLAFARGRHRAGVAEFRQGDAMALPFSPGSFDAAVMALVIFFIPDPARGVAEMARVASPGGTVAAYAWDLFGGGFPLEPIQAELRALGVAPLMPPSPGASRTEALRQLWTDAGLEAIETREIAVERTFADFEDFWTVSLLGSSIRQTLAAMTSGDMALLKERVRKRLPPDSAGRVTAGARANAIKGRVRR